MTLTLNLLSEQDWILGRVSQPSKLSNSYLIGNFNKAISAIKDTFTQGSIYYNNIVHYDSIDNISLIYEETSPYINLFSLAPKNFYSKDQYFCNLWRYTDVDSNIINIFNNIPSSKYKNNELQYSIPKDYILFAMQSDSQQLDKNYNKQLIQRTLQFAKENKIHILFKLHPFTNYRTRFLQDLIIFKGDNLLSPYSHIVSHKYSTNHLITNAQQVWTFSSGVALEAVIKHKKVVSFYPSNDFESIVNIAYSPEEAFYSNKISTENILRFLTWYYYKLCIDLFSNTFDYNLYDRCDKFFNKKLSLKQIFT